MTCKLENRVIVVSVCKHHGAIELENPIIVVSVCKQGSSSSPTVQQLNNVNR